MHRWKLEPAYASFTPAALVLSPILSCLKFSAVYSREFHLRKCSYLACLWDNIVVQVERQPTSGRTTDGDIEVYYGIGHR
jgi:hypothetical protein